MNWQSFQMRSYNLTMYIFRVLSGDYVTLRGSRLMQEVFQRLGVNKTHTIPLHPQSESVVQWYIKAVEEHLQKVVLSHQRSWDARLPIFLAYRASTHNTGLTAANLMFGRKRRLPCDLLFGTHSRKEWPTVDHVENWMDIYTTARVMPEAGQWPGENSIQQPREICWWLPGGQKGVVLSINPHEREVAQAPILMEGPIPGSRPDTWYGIQDSAES
jgi:hypothetical protein